MTGEQEYHFHLDVLHGALMISINEAVKKICLSLPDTEEVSSHGFPTYKVNGKGFATFSLNHHGDELVALLLNIGRETQQMLVESAPDYFFIPPYTGPKGWVGINLNKDLAWTRVSQLTWNTYCRVAPAALARSTEPVVLQDKVAAMTPEEINPIRSANNQKLLKKLRKICLNLPETSEDLQFGNPNFRAGKKAFCNLSATSSRVTLQFWAGPDRQSSLTAFDERFKVPPYVGHRGWLNLDLTHQQNWPEIEQLILNSYRHFALQRMLKALDIAD